MTIYRLPVNLNWSGGGAPGVNIWHLRTSGGAADSQELQNAVSELRQMYFSLNTCGPGGLSIFQNNMTMTASEAVNVETQEFVPVDFAQVTASSGDRALPQANQICVSWRTSVAARRGMGRTFFGPLNVSAVETDGSIATAILTPITSIVNAFVAAGAGLNGWSFGVYGLQVAAPQGTTDYSGLPRVLRDFTSGKVRDRFAVRRSRRD